MVTTAVAVAVWGGGTGGVAAALQSARSGATTLLLTPGPWLGGMVSAAGVCCPDGNELTPWQTGLWGAFLRELARCEPQGLDHNWVSCFGYRPTTAERILRRWVRAESRLIWWAGCRLEWVVRQGRTITALQVVHQGVRRRVAPQIVIDGSDRGDLFPLADVPFRLGWEASEQWSEPSAPSRQRLDDDRFFQAQPVQSPTWVSIGQLHAEQGPARPDKSAPERLPPPLPAPFTRCCERFGLERTLTYGRLPGGLVMLNWPLDGNDWHAGLERAFSGSVPDERDLFDAMRQHSLRFAQSLVDASDGLLTLGHGFPRDGSAFSSSLALMPYWREGRRIVGPVTVLEQHLLPMSDEMPVGALPLDQHGDCDSIAVGNYANDHHYPGPDWPLAPKSRRWGGRWTGTPFCIPYGALLSAALDNLIAADKGISTSHMANGATRLQPLVINVGQAAGLAAALSVQSRCIPVELPVRRLQESLIQDPLAPAAVVPLWHTPWHHPAWTQKQLDALNHPQESILADLDHSVAPLLQKPPCQEDVHASHWCGTVVPGGDGTFDLHAQGGECWPLITLEPAVHCWLQALDRPQDVSLIATANPWGPWLRVSAVCR